MTAITLPNSGLISGYTDGETGWGAAMNRNLRVLDALLNLRVLDKDLPAPPGSPVAGEVYIVGPASSGAWNGRAGQLAFWQAGDDITPAWAFVAPKSGWRAYAVDEAAEYRFDGSAWSLVASGGGSTGLRNTVTALAGSGSVAVDVSLGDYFTLALSNAVTGFTFAGMPGPGKGVSLVIRIVQDATARTVTWPSSFKWSGAAPSVSTASGSVDVLGLTSFDNGATWIATLSKGHA